MTLIGLLIFIVVFIVIGSLAFWVITKFLPDYRVPALAIVGVIMLIVLLLYFMPEVSGYRVWR